MLSFIFIKGAALGLNGVRGIVLAALLGPHGYGLFGTLVIVQQMLSYVALGVREGVAINLARSGSSAGDMRAICSSALAWGAFSALPCVAVVAVVQRLSGIAASQLAWVVAIAALSILNEILINISRHQHKLRKVAVIELAYNAVALAIVFACGSLMTVSLALLSTLAGAALSVALYAATLGLRPLGAPSWRLAGELIRIGLMPALFSAVLLLMTSFFVLVSNWFGSPERIGLVVFANNISTLLLFAMNTVSWGLASRSMTRLYQGRAVTDAPTRAHISDVFFRFGAVVIALLALVVQPALALFMPQYAGAGVYVLHICLFQIYALLLFNEINFAQVNSLLRPVIGGYAAMAGALAAACVLLRDDLLSVMRAAILIYFTLAIVVTLYMRSHAFAGGPLAQRIVALSFPAAAALAHAAAGAAGVAGISVLYLVALVLTNRHAMKLVLGASQHSRQLRR